MSNQMQFHEILSVSATKDQDVLIAKVDITTIDGERLVVDYASYPNDTFGLAPVVREAIASWIAEGLPVSPYVPPTPEDLRAVLQPLTQRQTRLALASIGITSADVEAALAGDAAGLIEWEYASQFERLHPLVVELGTVFSLPAEQIDDLWLWAEDL